FVVAKAEFAMPPTDPPADTPPANESPDGARDVASTALHATTSPAPHAHAAPSSTTLSPAASSPASPSLAAPSLSALAAATTPARLFVDRAGISYSTRTQLELRQDHAFAVDAVRREFDLLADFGPEFVARWRLFEVQTQAASKDEYLRRPDLGRRLSHGASELIAMSVESAVDLQIVIGDGLSSTAVAVQVPELLPLLVEEAKRIGWTVGRPFVVRYCRVGVLNEVGRLLDPRVAVLLVGERPGLAAADSLSAYMAFRPRPGHTDAQRNLISNIHSRGVSAADAARRIVALGREMVSQGASGVAIKEP
ncbi:MAG TPA: ethanolamine ammonia-lyase subunit EutC, partial [Pirellulaceae bacterium]|nr:ethanolamine ammonia-lyase subunit EutC [Pirellulaceae bacterium]